MKKRTLRATALVTALFVALVGLGAPAAVADGPTGTVTGTITFAGEPVVGAKVDLTPSTVLGGMWALTDAAGVYTIPDVPPGDYAARVSNALVDDVAHFDFLTTFSGDTVRMPDATYSAVVAGTTTTIDIAAIRGAAITGVVVDRDGEPVGGAWVRAINRHRAGYGTTRTDADGRYTIKGMAKGKVDVVASGPDAFEDDPWAPENPHGTAVVKARWGQTRTVPAITISGPRVGTLRATVKGVRKGDRVYVYETRSKVATLVKVAPKKGKVKVRAKLLAGRYRVTVAGSNKASKTVRVKAGRTVRVGTVKFPKRRTWVSGTVRGADGARLAGVHVQVHDTFGAVAGDAVTDEHGEYSVRAVLRGKYTVTAFDPGDRAAETTKKVTVRRGHNATRNIRMGQGFRVRGTVLAGSAPVEDLTVTAHYAWDVTNGAGKFALRNLPRGKHVVFVRDHFTGGYLDVTRTVKVTRNRNISLTVATS